MEKTSYAVIQASCARCASEQRGHRARLRARRRAPPTKSRACITITITLSACEPPLSTIVAAELSPAPASLTTLDVSRNSIAELPGRPRRVPLHAAHAGRLAQ